MVGGNEKMAHKVASVQTLYDDSMALYNDVVEGSGDYSAKTIIDDLAAGIANLKENWGGKDAGSQIQNVISVHNAMVGVRNALAALANESSKVAANYREIQNSNGAGLEQISALTSEVKTTMGDYSDDRDTIDIKPDVSSGQAKVNNAKTEMDLFIPKVRDAYNRIMENWTEGDESRNQAKEAFETFLTNVDTYKEVLAQASNSIDTAIKNYKM
jgi:uncharacterized protein YukE